MSNQRVTPSQRKQILDMLRKLQDDMDCKAGDIIKEFQTWCQKTGRECEPSHETVRKWCKLARGESLKGGREPRKGGFLYAFVLEKIKQLHPDDFEGMLLRSAGKLFASSDNHLPVGPLKRLHGTYAIFRRRWRRPDDADQFIQCVVTFEATFDRVIFRETERFGPSTGRGKDAIREEYTGYTFLFGSSIWIIAREDHRASVKFLTIHLCEQPLLTGNSLIESCQGNLIAVCGPGPNDSHRFVLKRSGSKDLKCAYKSRAEIEKILDREDFSYLCYGNGHT